jgi:hypothetical protein
MTPALLGEGRGRNRLTCDLWSSFSSFTHQMDSWNIQLSLIREPSKYKNETRPLCFTSNIPYLIFFFSSSCDFCFLTLRERVRRLKGLVSTSVMPHAMHRFTCVHECTHTLDCQSQEIHEPCTHIRYATGA